MAPSWLARAVAGASALPHARPEQDARASVGPPARSLVSGDHARSGSSAGGRSGELIAPASDQVGPGSDAKLGVDLVQVVLHRAGTEEQLLRDLPVRQPFTDQPYDLQLL